MEGGEPYGKGCGADGVNHEPLGEARKKAGKHTLQYAIRRGAYGPFCFNFASSRLPSILLGDRSKFHTIFSTCVKFRRTVAAG